MARYVSNPANPTLLGEDLESMAFEAVGVVLTGAGNDKIVSPILKNFVPGIFGSEAIGKVADAVSTALTAWALGEAAGMVNSRAGRLLRRGGMVYFAAKVISVFVPGFSLSGALPTSLTLSNPFARMAAPPANRQLAAGSAVNTLAASQPAPLRLQGVGSSGI